MSTQYISALFKNRLHRAHNAANVITLWQCGRNVSTMLVMRYLCGAHIMVHAVAMRKITFN